MTGVLGSGLVMQVGQGLAMVVGGSQTLLIGVLEDGNQEASG